MRDLRAFSGGQILLLWMGGAVAAFALLMGSFWISAVHANRMGIPAAGGQPAGSLAGYGALALLVMAALVPGALVVVTLVWWLAPAESPPAG